MKGYVYVISNPGMPELVKVGYSMKDPKLRATELNHTGTPHNYVVDYWVLVENPEQIEARVHSAIRHLREGKEWFRCSREEAVNAIQKVAGSGALLEEFTHVDRERTKEMRRMRELEESKARQKLEFARQSAEERQRTEDARRQELMRLEKECKQIMEKYEENSKAILQRSPCHFWKLWLGATPLVWAYGVIVRVNLNRPPFDLGLLFCGCVLSVLVALVPWLALYGWWYFVGAAQSEDYRNLMQKRDSELTACRRGF